MTTIKTILFAIPTLAIHDAMGRDLLAGAKAFSEAGYDVKIYAEYSPKDYKGALVSKTEALAIIGQQDSLFFYHMGVFWNLLPELLRHCRGKFVVKYHNMTPPRFFEGYDQGSVAATKLGLDQVRWMVGRHPPDALIGASSFNVKEFSAAAGGQNLSVKKIGVIAPFVSVEELQSSVIDSDLKTKLSQYKTNILFVGRLVPNKGHGHLIAAMKSYEQLYGADVQLVLCGSLGAGFSKYRADLLRLAKIGGVSSHVLFVHDAGTSRLATLYRHSQVFLCMSEHEGFCVPVVEAQMLDLPVVAWDQGAVAETAGDGGLVLKALNYDVFATAIYRLQSDVSFRKEMLSKGTANAARFSKATTSRQHIDFISGL